MEQQKSEKLTYIRLCGWHSSLWLNRQNWPRCLGGRDGIHRHLSITAALANHVEEGRELFPSRGVMAFSERFLLLSAASKEACVSVHPSWKLS